MASQAPAPRPVLPPAVEGPAFLSDGTQVWVRPVLATDRGLVGEFVERESLQAIEARYFPGIRFAGTPEAIASPGDRLCLLVLGDRADQVIVLGVGEYARNRTAPDLAEVGFLVAGTHHGHGIASLLLARLARAARGFGILRFDARVRDENPSMLEVFRESGLPYAEEQADGEVHVLIPLSTELHPQGWTNGGSPGPLDRSGTAPA